MPSASRSKRRIQGDDGTVFAAALIDHCRHRRRVRRRPLCSRDADLAHRLGERSRRTADPQCWPPHPVDIDRAMARRVCIATIDIIVAQLGNQRLVHQREPGLRYSRLRFQGRLLRRLAENRNVLGNRDGWVNDRRGRSRRGDGYRFNGWRRRCWSRRDAQGATTGSRTFPDAGASLDVG